MDEMEKEKISIHDEKKRLERSLASFEHPAKLKDFDRPSEKEELLKNELEATKNEIEALQKTYLSLVKSHPVGLKPNISS